MACGATFMGLPVFVITRPYDPTILVFAMPDLRSEDGAALGAPDSSGEEQVSCLSCCCAVSAKDLSLYLIESNGVYYGLVVLLNIVLRNFSVVLNPHSTNEVLGIRLLKKGITFVLFITQTLLHTIFEKSRVADTELFSLDVNIAKQLLSSFDGIVIYPKDETKKAIFEEAADNSKSLLIPDGQYTFERKKKSDNRIVKATAIIRNGNWKIMKGSVLGIHDDKGGAQKAREIRKTMAIDNNGLLLEDADLGVCTPTFAGCVVLNQANNGWEEWKTMSGQPIDVYRVKSQEE